VFRAGSIPRFNRHKNINKSRLFRPFLAIPRPQINTFTVLPHAQQFPRLKSDNEKSPPGENFFRSFTKNADETRFDPPVQPPHEAWSTSPIRSVNAAKHPCRPEPKQHLVYHINRFIASHFWGWILRMLKIPPTSTFFRSVRTYSQNRDRRSTRIRVVTKRMLSGTSLMRGRVSLNRPW
jgi:hypothetical protein